MLDALYELGLFSAKALVIVLVILILLGGILAIFSRGKEKSRGRISIKNLNKNYLETTEILSEEILNKKQFKKFLKDQRNDSKKKRQVEGDFPPKNIFVLNFCGDIKGSAVS